MECPECGESMSRYDTTYKVGGWSGWECPTSSDHTIYDDGIDVEEVKAHQKFLKSVFQQILTNEKL